MRFLNTSTLEFVQIPDSELHLKENQYAILSHRWGAGEDEVSFQDLHLSTEFPRKKGFDKIRGFCNQASLANCRYGWVDTCCINKGDPNELSEAINSMYQLYQDSKFCIAYLKDVPQKQLMDSEWFDRGWTLQELIAPKAVTFFDHDWKIIGTRTDLIADLSRKTRLPKGILSNATKPSAYSIAQRMSWAANRVTTRVEDRAYSLMGIFSINMPLIYGEREKAFLRLQREIIRETKDESILAWDQDLSSPAGRYFGPFAPTLSAFAKCSNLVTTQGSHGFTEGNGGLSLWPTFCQLGPETYLAALHCTDRGHPNSKKFILIGGTSTESGYVRMTKAGIASQGLVQKSDWARFEKRQIRILVNPTEPPLNIFNGFWLRTLKPPGYINSRTTILSNCQASEADHVYQREYSQGVTGIVHMKSLKRSNLQWITVSFDVDSNPVLWLTQGKEMREFETLFRQVIASGIGSRAHHDLMKTCQNLTEEFVRRQEPLRRSVITKFNRKGEMNVRIVPDLKLKIQVQLQPYHTPPRASTGDINDSGSLPNLMKIWVVDITEARDMGRTSRTPHRRLQVRVAVSILVLVIVLTPLMVWATPRTSAP